MSRRLSIATMFLVLALLCLLLVGMSSSMRADGTTDARAATAPGPAGTGAQAGVPRPSPCLVPAPRLPGGGTMSGEFAHTNFACLADRHAPSIYVPSERWFHGHAPGTRHLGGGPRPSGPLLV